MRLIDADKLIDKLYENEYTILCPLDEVSKVVDNCPEIDAQKISRDRWIPVTERLPEPETEVMIVCNDNGRRFIATAIHENGKQLSEESCWVWTDIWEYGRYDEEHDDYFVPEGWWESRCFTPDDVYNCMVDCEVTHWMPMPELPEEKNDGDK